MTFGFTFDQNAAKEAGVGGGLSSTGAYECVVTSAVLEFGKDGSQSRTMMISVDSQGAKANFIRINFIGREGQQIHGYKIIMAMMWAAGLRDLNAVQRHTPEGVEHHFPALEGKMVGLVLQKVLYTKGDGSDGFKFEVRHVFKPSEGGKTYREFSEGKPAEDVAKLLEVLTDKDERQKGGAVNDRGGYGNRNPAQGNNSWGDAGGWGAPNPNDVPTSRLQQANRQQQPQGPQDDPYGDGIPF